MTVVAGFKEHWKIMWDRDRGEYWWYVLNVHGNYMKKGPVRTFHGPLKGCRRHVR